MIGSFSRQGGRKVLVARDSSGRTPLAYAQSVRRHAMIRWLYESGAVPERRQNTSRPDTSDIPLSNLQLLEQVVCVHWFVAVVQKQQFSAANLRWISEVRWFIARGIRLFMSPCGRVCGFLSAVS